MSRSDDSGVIAVMKLVVQPHVVDTTFKETRSPRQGTSQYRYPPDAYLGGELGLMRVPNSEVEQA